MDDYEKHVRNQYSRLAAEYDRFYNRNIHIAEDEFVRCRIAELYHEGDKVLEIGCGTGALLYAFPFPAEDYMGFDPCWDMLDQAKSLFPLHQFFCLSAEHMPAFSRERGSFDFIVSTFMAPSYIHDLNRFASDVWKSLKPHGRAFLQFAGPKHIFRGSKYTLIRESPVNYFIHPARELRKAFRMFSKVKIYAMGVLGDGIDMLPLLLCEQAMKLDHVLGQAFPDAGYFTVVELVK